MKKTAFILFVLGLFIWSCKKDKLITDTSAKVKFSQDSILFDTVFTTLGSITKNFRVVNPNSQKIKISNIRLQNGSASQYIINVDGAKGTEFNDIEIAAKDSMYIFVQVNVNPNNQTAPFIVQDNLIFTVNGNQQQVVLQSYGQNAYYHKATRAFKFKDGTYFTYSILGDLPNAVTANGNNYTLKTDKPHVIFGYFVIDSLQKLTVPAGARFFMNYKAGVWVFKDGEIQVNGTKGNEVIFTSVRRDADYIKEAGQWDRIWINEGSNNNVINYAIIKNGFVGIQAELFGNVLNYPGRLKLTNTKIHNMSLWGLFGFAYNIYGYNNVISNCKDNAVNLSFGGKYTFLHCTFANYWDNDKPREKPAVRINNYSPLQVLPLDSCYFGNCIIDGKFDNELDIDLSTTTASLTPNLIFSSCWLKTNLDLSNSQRYISVRNGTSPEYESPSDYDFKPKTNQTILKNFTHPKALQDVQKPPGSLDINVQPRNQSSVTAGAYEF